ncbi:MAG: GMC family oxidoreductase [Balneolaceae bacterium]|nr:GMC family oxidoreductase [Balneolaceae bacterium]
MVIDLKTDPVPELQPYDVCIVGAGAAGITIALGLASSSLRVCLVESGGFEPSEETQNLYTGETAGNLPGEGYLRGTRLRYFGGTTNHWGGWCRPLDPIDFEKRSWVPDSGWPIDRAELEPWYREAERLVEIRPFHSLSKRGHLDQRGHRFDGMRTPWFQWSPPTRFGDRYRREIVEAENIDLFLNANVTGFRLGENARRVERLPVRSLNGKAMEIEAARTVLACGGIENPRLLLNCTEGPPGGLGNGHGLVGKYFMEHPHYGGAGLVLVWDARIIRWGRWREFRLHNREDVPRTRFFALQEKTQREEELLNISFQFRRLLSLSDPGLGERETSMARAVARLSEQTQVELSDWDRLTGLRLTDQAQLFTCYVRAEQIPDASNAVRLTGEKDALGLRKVRLACRVSYREADSYRRSLRLLAGALGRERMGRLRLDLDRASRVDGGAHHMGTTRMSAHPGEGVVNPDCRVHGMDNHIVAGSSVFPTSGFAHPTLTLVALAARLADHLRKSA